jgi:hypothetical protein
MGHNLVVKKPNMKFFQQLHPNLSKSHLRGTLY